MNKLNGEERMLKLKKNTETGITLIALVVTITVLIILATASINAVLGQNGIIKKAKQAKEMYSNSIAKDNEKMQELLNEMAQYNEGSSSDDGKVTLPDGWNGDKVNPVKSKDNVVVPVPKGYVESTVEGEDSVSTGFVIKEGNDGNKTSGVNEFVWVPVSNISDIYDEANNAGQRWDFGTYSSPKNPAIKITYPTTQNNGYREPDVVTGASSGSDSTSGTQYDAVSSNLQQAGLSSTATASDFKTQLQTEFKEMINSVKTYGGFYIGRYETGNLSQSKAVVQKNNSDINNQTWYTMYKVCKTIKANENVTTSMLWGCQWDATLRWMQTSSNSDVANFSTNSEGKGNYSGTQGDKNKIISTGSNNAYAVNNIYDMAGNVWDCTIEAYNTDLRVLRGGLYASSGSSFPASVSGGSNPRNRSDSFGCRSVLYVK